MTKSKRRRPERDFTPTPSCRSDRYHDQKSMRPPFERRITGGVLELESRIGRSICVKSK